MKTNAVPSPAWKLTTQSGKTMKYDKQKVLKYIDKDMFLKFVWEKRKQDLSVNDHEKLLEAIYNTYIAETPEALAGNLK